jgi:hypothetical protein
MLPLLLPPTPLLDTKSFDLGLRRPNGNGHGSLYRRHTTVHAFECARGPVRPNGNVSNAQRVICSNALKSVGREMVS